MDNIKLKNMKLGNINVENFKDVKSNGTNVKDVNLKLNKKSLLLCALIPAFINPSFCSQHPIDYFKQPGMSREQLIMSNLLSKHRSQLSMLIDSQSDVINGNLFEYIDELECAIKCFFEQAKVQIIADLHVIIDKTQQYIISNKNLSETKSRNGQECIDIMREEYCKLQSNNYVLLQTVDEIELEDFVSLKMLDIFNKLECCIKETFHREMIDNVAVIHNTYCNVGYAQLFFSIAGALCAGYKEIENGDLDKALRWYNHTKMNEVNNFA